MTSLQNAIFLIVFVLAVLLGLSVTFLWVFQERFVFPRLYKRERVQGFTVDGLDWKAVQTDAGIAFLVYEPTTIRQDIPAVLFLHGNGVSTAWGAVTMAFLAREGFPVASAEYPGYSGNSGSPSESALKEAASQIEQWARSRWFGRPLVVVGESIGSAPAVWLASQGRADLLVLDSPFTSLSDVITSIFPWLPGLSTLNRNPMDNRASLLEAMAIRILPPTLVLISAYDPIVPVHMGIELAGMVPGAELVRTGSRGHTALTVDRINNGHINSRVLEWIYAHTSS